MKRLSDATAWKKAKTIRTPSPNGSGDEGPAENGGADAVYAPSFKESQEKNNCRLAEIAAMSVDDFNASAELIVKEVERMRPRPPPGWIHKGGMFVKTFQGRLVVGKPHSKDKVGAAWKFLLDISQATNVKDKMVYLENFQEVGAPAPSFE